MKSYSLFPLRHRCKGCIRNTRSTWTTRIMCYETIRFPLDLIKAIEIAIVAKEVSFSSFVIQACRYALENMDKPD